jgi:hypothetical protein
MGSLANSLETAKGITGYDYVPLNGGRRRTESKRILLRAIAESAASCGAAPRFRADIG